AVQALLNPTDTVQWALYYPALDPGTTADSPSARAGRLLRVGRVDAAEREIGSAPESGDAIALGSIIALVKNDKPRALELAQRAVSTDATSVRALLALSYAKQA